MHGAPEQGPDLSGGVQGFPLIPVFPQRVLFRFIEDHRPVLAARTACPLLIGGQVLFFFTFLTTATLIFCSAGIALYKEQVAAIILAVGMRIAGRTAQVALGYHIFRNALTKSLVKHEVLTLEL